VLSEAKGSSWAGAVVGISFFVVSLVPQEAASSSTDNAAREWFMRKWEWEGECSGPIMDKVFENQ
jgi:hypothetical protein